MIEVSTAGFSKGKKERGGKECTEGKGKKEKLERKAHTIQEEEMRETKKKKNHTI